MDGHKINEILMDAVVSWKEMTPFFIIKADSGFIPIYKSPKDIPTQIRTILLS